jgi:hypothetical protein
VRATRPGAGHQAVHVNALPGQDIEKLKEEVLKNHRLVIAWQDLLGRAEVGNSAAVYQLVRTVLSGAKLLQKIVLSGEEETLKEVQHHARWETQWPILKSPHLEFDTKEKGVFELLQLGANLDFLLGSEARAKHDPLAQLTLALLADVKKEVWFYRATDPSKGLGSDEILEKRERQPRWVREVASFPALSKETAPMWWKVVKKLFDSTWPELSKNPELLKLGGKKGPRIKSKLKERVRQKLMSLAPK